MKIGSGTMYGAVSNMIKKGWIMESDEESEELQNRGQGVKKKQYVLTDAGRRILEEETAGKCGKGDRKQAVALIFAERENEEENLLPAGWQFFFAKYGGLKDEYQNIMQDIYGMGL